MTDPLPDLSVKIKGDASSAVDAIAEVEAAEKSLTDTSSKTSAKIKKDKQDEGAATKDWSNLVKKSNGEVMGSFEDLGKIIDQQKSKIKDLQKAGSPFGDIAKAKGDLKNFEALGSLLTESFAKEGTNAADAFISDLSTGLQGAFQGGLMSPGGLAAIGGLVTAGAPIISAAIASAVTTGFGLGITGLGVLAVKNNPGVKTAASNLAGVLKDELSGAASSFVQPVQDGIAIIKKDLLSDRGALTDLFSAAAPGVTQLADGLGGLVKNALPGFVQGMQDAQPLVAELAKDMPTLGATFGNFITEISDAPGEVNDLKATLDALEGTITIVGVGLHGLTAVMAPVNDLAIKLGNASRDLSNDLGLTAPAAAQASAATDGVSQSFTTLKDSTADAEAELTNFMDVYNTWVTDAQNSDDTLLKMDQAWTTFNKQLKTGTKNWNENTAAGQKQVGNLNLLNERITDYYGSLAKLHPLTKDQTRAELDAETQLYNTAKAAGASTDELATLKGEISGLNKQLANFKSPPPITLTANVRINETASVRRTMGRLDPGANYANSGVQTGQGSLPHYDASGIYAGGDQPLYRFGEQSVIKEALIAKNGDAGRALSSLREAAGWHGMAVTPATASGSPMSGHGGGAHVAYINATIMMNGKAVARQLIGPVGLTNQQSATSIYGA